MNLKEIEGLVERVVRSEGLELYDLKFDRSCLRVYVEGRDGVTVEKCRELSQLLSQALDDADPIPGPYRLEVSSPGVECHLSRPEHFRRALGAQVRVVTRDGFREGRLEQVVEDGVWVGEEFINFSAIRHARLKVSTDELFRRSR